jgi:hypothetical protein
MHSPRMKQQDSNGPSPKGLRKVSSTEDMIPRCRTWTQRAERLSACLSRDERPEGVDPDTQTSALVPTSPNELSSVNSIARHEPQVQYTQVQSSCKGPIRTKRGEIPCA